MGGAATPSSAQRLYREPCFHQWTAGIIQSANGASTLERSLLETLTNTDTARSVARATTVVLIPRPSKNRTIKHQMPYAYYDTLSARDKATYRESARMVRVPLQSPELLWPLVGKIRDALEDANRAGVQTHVQRLVTKMAADLGAPPVRVRVLAARPSHDWGELQGLYEPDDDDEAVITVWMRTAAKKRVVAFKTFLRTVLHEMCHHLDYELYELEESFHTEGFFKRESSLFHQIAGRDTQSANAGAEPDG